MTTHETLMGARAEIEKGWCKYLAEDRFGNVCSVGAVRRVCRSEGSLDLQNAAIDAALRCLYLAVPGSTSIPLYNDRASTTKADVLALFDRALVAVADQAHDFAVA